MIRHQTLGQLVGFQEEEHPHRAHMPHIGRQRADGQNDEPLEDEVIAEYKAGVAAAAHNAGEACRLIGRTDDGDAQHIHKAARHLQRFR